MTPTGSFFASVTSLTHFSSPFSTVVYLSLCCVGLSSSDLSQNSAHAWPFNRSYGLMLSKLIDLLHTRFMLTFTSPSLSIHNSSACPSTSMVSASHPFPASMTQLQCLASFVTLTTIFPCSVTWHPSLFLTGLAPWHAATLPFMQPHLPFIAASLVCPIRYLPLGSLPIVSCGTSLSQSMTLTSRISFLDKSPSNISPAPLTPPPLLPNISSDN